MDRRTRGADGARHAEWSDFFSPTTPTTPTTPTCPPETGDRAANFKENAARIKEFAARIKEFAAHIKEFAARIKEFAAHIKEFAARIKEFAAHIKEFAAHIKEFAAHTKEFAAHAQKNAAHAPPHLASPHFQHAAAGEGGLDPPSARTPPLQPLPLQTVPSIVARHDRGGSEQRYQSTAIVQSDDHGHGKGLIAATCRRPPLQSLPRQGGHRVPWAGARADPRDVDHEGHCSAKAPNHATPLVLFELHVMGRCTVPHEFSQSIALFRDGCGRDRARFRAILQWSFAILLVLLVTSRLSADCLNDTPIRVRALPGCNQIIVTWPTGFGQSTLFEIERRHFEGDNEIVENVHRGTVDGGVLDGFGWYDRNFEYGVTYGYRVAINDPTPGCGVGTYSLWTNAAQAIRPSSSVPINLRATGVCNGVLLEFDRSAVGLSEQGRFLRRRADQPDAWQLLWTSTSLWDGTFFDRPPSAVAWVYQLEITGNGCPVDVIRETSGEVTVGPYPSVHVTASEILCDRVRINWDEPTSPVSGFVVRRDNPFGTIVGDLPSTARSFEDVRSPPLDVDYCAYYVAARVDGCSGAGGGLWSGQWHFQGTILNPPPTDRYVAVGESLVLSVDAVSEGGPLRYSWVGPCGVDLTTRGGVSGVNGPVLIIHDMSASDANSECGRYELYVRSDCGMRYFQVLVHLNQCVADVDDGTGSGVPDGGVTVEDLLLYLSLFAEGRPRADLDDGTGNGAADGGVTIEDLLYYMLHYQAGC